MCEQVRTRDSGHISLYVRELREELTSYISAGLAIVSGLVWVLLLAQERFENQQFVAFFSLFLETMAAFRLRNARPWISRAVLLLGPSCSLVLAMNAMDSPVVPYFAAVIVVANAAIDPRLGLAAAIVNTLALLVTLPHDELLVSALILLWSTAGTSWVASRGLYRTLRWLWDSQENSHRLLGQLRDRQGELNRTLIALEQATQRIERANRELSIARQEAEDARQIKAQFAANVSHELRTPLNLIIGFSEMMVRSPEVYGSMLWPPALRADIREIHRSASLLLGLIDDILTLSRVDAQRLPLRLETVDLAELIQESASIASGLLRDKVVDLRVNVPESLPPILVDRTRIRQVLLNLLNNAIRFTDAGWIEVAARVMEAEIIVEVRDTGVGIAEDDLQVIFEVFGQAKGAVTTGRGGTGLGLAVCRQFVRLHGGRIEAESQLGKGSTFRFALPLVAREQLRPGLSYYAPRRWSPVEAESPADKTVLVLASDVDMATTLARTVEGYRALPTDRLTELGAAVEAEHPAGIVWLDSASAPDDLDPEEIWQAAGHHDLPIIRCRISESRQAQRLLGVSDYLVKPIQHEELHRAVGALAGEATATLVVDDDPGFVALMTRMLEIDFPLMRVYRAYSGPEALAILREEAVGIVLLDLNMPEMSGLEVLQTVRQDMQLGELPIIVITASDYKEELPSLCATRIEVFTRARLGSALLGRYVRALLDLAPPDYTRSAPHVVQPVSAAERPAS